MTVDLLKPKLLSPGLKGLYLLLLMLEPHQPRTGSRDEQEKAEGRSNQTHAALLCPS